MSYIIYGILIYLALVFIFRVVVPVYMATRKFKKGFREMKDRMQEHVQQQQGYTAQTNPGKPSQSPPKWDYIEFEEIK